MSFFRGPQFPDLMVDIETLSTRPDAAIISIAAVFFNVGTRQFATPTFYAEVDHETLDGFHVDPQTVAWWAKQTRATRHHSAGNGPGRPAGLRPRQPARVWANSPSFDLVVLKEACRKLDLSWPINFWQERDVRTVKDLARLPKTLPTHNAIEDCISQIRTVTDGLNAILLK